MSFLVAIEGADGAGKATAADNLKKALIANGVSATVISFPRYKETVGGIALGEFLSGRMPVPVTAQTAAVLYALDRFESVSFVAEAARLHDVVIFDRYIASNMVYQASKVAPDEAARLMEWIFRLETQTFGVAPPHLSIYLDTPLETARELMLRKQRRSYTERQFDEHEADNTLQRNVRRNYAAIAEAGLDGPWYTIHTTRGQRLRSPEEIASEIAAHVLNAIGVRQPLRSERVTASRA